MSKMTHDSKTQADLFTERLADLHLEEHNKPGWVAGTGHVLILKDEGISKTESGLVLPREIDPSQGQGVIFSVGPDLGDFYKPGMRLVFKDSAAFVGGNVVTKESAIYIDKVAAPRVVGVKKEQIVAIR